MNIDPETLTPAKPFFLPENGPRKPDPLPTWSDIDGHLNAAQDSLRHAHRLIIDYWRRGDEATLTLPKFETDVFDVIRRITQIRNEQQPLSLSGKLPRYLVANIGDNTRSDARELVVRLRRSGVGAILSGGSRELSGQLRQATALKIPYTLILSADEISRGEVVVRNMAESTQESRPMAEFLEQIGVTDPPSNEDETLTLIDGSWDN